MKKQQITTGTWHTLGSTACDGGVNFAVYSAHAEQLDICLYDEQDRETACLPLPANDYGIWHGFVPGISAGQRYAVRAHGPQNLYFDSQKRLLDPYAKALHYSPSDGQPLRSVVTHPESPVCGDRTRHEPGLIYEAHVRGLTQQFPELAESLRGSYGALAHTRVIDHLKALGVDTIELLPVQTFVDEPHLEAKALSNYWGYNPVAFFVPHAAYAQNPAEANDEFRAMVRAFHDANIRVVLDVVFNHTAEGGADGPVWSFRGIDNPTYYRMEGEHFANYTGCGNTINADHPMVQRLIIDCLRHWAEAYEVDGFRFDLGVTLGRTKHGFCAQHPLLCRIADDHLLKDRLLISEPWDVGPDGYRLGGFAPPWMEWNDRCRDDLRAYWRGEPGAHAALARRLHGSSELFERSGRGPQASVNFIAAHDGFVLDDLVSYAHKHNHANGEGNADGHDHNLSDNMGCEGTTDDPEILAGRQRRKRALTTTLLLCQGTPMWLAGDEAGNTQHGNNNAYCQDNPTGWVDWSQNDGDLAELLNRLTQLRQRTAMFHQSIFVHEDVHEDRSVCWFNHNGDAMHEEDWHCSDAPFTMDWCTGTERVCALFNRSTDSVNFQLPEPATWQVLIDSSTFGGRPTQRTCNDTLIVAPQSVAVVSNMEIDL